MTDSDDYAAWRDSLAQDAPRADELEGFEEDHSHRRIRLRVMQDIWSSASATYWRRRAETFEQARPRPGDFTGQATPEDIRRRDQRLAETAQHCRDLADAYERERPVS